MGLISKTAIAKWNSRTKKWFEEKGYKWTRQGELFEVKIEDLQDGSNIIVVVECDICGNIFSKPYNNINRYFKKDEEYHCKTCKNKLRISDNSFEKWCIENSRQDVLERWDYELNKLRPNEITYSVSKKYWFKCSSEIHKSELKCISDFTSGQEGSIKCNQCNSFAQWGIDNLGEDFLDKYWSDKNILNPWEISYSSNKKIFIKCKKKDYHDDYKISPNMFIAGNRCSYCSNQKIHPKDSLGQYIFDNFEQDFLDKIWSDKNEKSAFEYAPNSNKEVWWKCANGKHEDYKRTIYSSNNYDFHCSSCTRERKESFLQEKVRLYLEETNYTILHEEKCTIVPKNPKTKYPLPFDNEIKELKLICEVNGFQHYNKNSKWIDKWSQTKNMSRKEVFHYQQLKDRYKRVFAIQQGYFYLEIPYWTDDKEETWKQLIDNKLKEINQ